MIYNKLSNVSDYIRVHVRVVSWLSLGRLIYCFFDFLTFVCRKPENGIKYLVERKFLDNRPSAIARFLIARKGLSKQMIGEYLGNLQNPFVMEVLRFAVAVSLYRIETSIDVANVRNRNKER